MTIRLQTLFPVAIVIALLAFAWTEFALRFTFVWFTEAPIPGSVIGFPREFQFVFPFAFITWGLFFAAGGDRGAFGRVLVSSVIGSLAALAAIPVAFTTGRIPDFNGIAIWSGVAVLILVLLLAIGDWYYLAGALSCFGAVLAWWIASGFDGWVPNGGGVARGPAAFSSDGTGRAGFGALSGLLSEPWPWVWASVLATLACGCVLGLLSAVVSARVTRAGSSVGRSRPEPSAWEL